jgi:imidazolonepropionase-like amidohydrolase
MSVLFFLLSASLAFPVGPVQAAAGQDSSRTFAVRASKLHLGDGRTIDDGVLLVEGGRIRAVGAGVSIPSDADVIVHSGSVTAGMVACHGYCGVAGEAGDPTRSVLPEAYVVDAFDATRLDYKKALRAGITTVMLTPSTSNLVGGISGVVKTSGGRVLEREANLAISLSSEAQWLNRFPTSPIGAVSELERLFQEGGGAFGLAASGRLPVLLHAVERHEIQRALDFAMRHELKGALNRAPLAGELAGVVKQSGLAVIVGPFASGTDRRELKSVLALSEAGVKLGFGLDDPWLSPETLRFSAALCVREGLDPAAAWKALTADGAQIAGVGDRVGKLERGYDADFVLWSGDPLDLGSSVQAVFVDGKRAWGGKP